MVRTHHGSPFSHFYVGSIVPHWPDHFCDSDSKDNTRAVVMLSYARECLLYTAATQRAHAGKNWRAPMRGLQHSCASRVVAEKVTMH